MRTILVTLGLLATVLLPVAAAANDTYNVPPTVDVNVNNGQPSESTGFAGMSTTALIVLIVLAVLVIALVVALAARGRDYP